MTDDELERWVKDRATAISNRIRTMDPHHRTLEFESLAIQLVMACADAGATNWPESLHLGDVFEKHLMRAVVIPESSSD